MTARSVLIHGFTGAPTSFDEIVQRLGEHTVFRPVLLGHGAAAPSATSFEGEVARLAAAIERAGFIGAQLCGYSLGGRLALGLLSRHPDWFPRATLVGVHPGLRDASEREARRRADERWCELLEGRGIEAFVEAWDAQPLFATQRGVADRARAAQDRVRRSHDPTELARALRVLGLAEMPCYEPWLERQAANVTLVVGEHDLKFRGIGERLAASNRGLRLVVVESAGHNVVLEAPERLVELLQRGAA